MEKFVGCGTALVTPFQADESVDEEALRRLVERQIEAGIDFLVPCGTTGESPTLLHEEHHRVIEIVIDQAAGRVPIMAGTGSNSTAEAVSLTEHAKQAGAQAVLAVVPYYNKPPQRGMVHYFTSIADVGLPVFGYNIPGRTGVNMLPETQSQMSHHPNYAGIKEATANLEQMTQDILVCNQGTLFLSGDDTLTLPLMVLGGHGVISVVSNIIPAVIKELVDAALAGDWESARELHLRYFPLSKAMFCETNPIPVKWALSALGLVLPVWRSPMVPPLESQQAIIRSEMEKVGLLNPII